MGDPRYCAHGEKVDVPCSVCGPEKLEQDARTRALAEIGEAAVEVRREGQLKASNYGVIAYRDKRNALDALIDIFLARWGGK